MQANTHEFSITDVVPQTLEEASFSYSPIAQLIIDPHADQILRANISACRLFKRDVLGFTQQRVSELFALCFAELIILTEAAIAHGSSWSDALVFDGGDTPYKLEVTAQKLVHEDHTLLTLFLQDQNAILAQRQVAEAQRHYSSGLGHWNQVSRVFQEFERENQLILDAAGEGIYGVDVNGLTTFMNPAAERILGFTSSELAGKNMHEMIHYCHGDGSHYDAIDCPIFAAFRDGEVHKVENDVFWSKYGKAVDVEYTSTPIRDNGRLVGAVIVFRDVTQKKMDRQKLLAALQEVQSLKNRLEQEKAYLQEEINSEFNHHQIIGNSPAIQQVIQQIELVAPTDATVLVNGESGTGKELIARAIHELSERRDRPLIRVNCAAVPSELFESEFFGHVKGAFTGATADRPGRFELADGGTIFLDEVGEIPLHLQSKLLRVLQEQQFERIGESRTRTTDVRIIAATNRNLHALVRLGKFREDLYFRLNVFPIASVPLRDRLEDIPLLAQHFLKRSSTNANKPGLKIPLSELDKLQQYDWPGNIRELENIIERQVILAQGDRLRFTDLAEKTPAEAQTPQRQKKSIVSEHELKLTERRNIQLALEKCQGKVFGEDGAAALLGLKPTTLASRIKKMQLDPRQFKPSHLR